MLAAAISTVTLGATLAYVASSLPRYQAAFETIAGWLLIGGFGLLGYAIEWAIGQP